MSKKPKIYWAGFISGELHEYFVSSCTYAPHWEAAIFLKKKDAKEQYEDVRKVKIVEVKK